MCSERSVQDGKSRFQTNIVEDNYLRWAKGHYNGERERRGTPAKYTQIQRNTHVLLGKKKIKFAVWQGLPLSRAPQGTNGNLLFHVLIKWEITNTSIMRRGRDNN